MMMGLMFGQNFSLRDHWNHRALNWEISHVGILIFGVVATMSNRMGSVDLMMASVLQEQGRVHKRKSRPAEDPQGTIKVVVEEASTSSIGPLFGERLV